MKKNAFWSLNCFNLQLHSTQPLVLYKQRRCSPGFSSIMTWLKLDEMYRENSVLDLLALRTQLVITQELKIHNNTTITHGEITGLHSSEHKSAFI